MNENKETSMNENEQPKKKMGRPRKQRNYILYRSGRKLKAWNMDLCIDMRPSEKDLTGNVTIYDGLGEDYVAWGRRLTREGYYNTATRFPFRPAPDTISMTEIANLEQDYRDYPQLRRVMDTCEELFEGRIPSETVICKNPFWMRVLGNIYIREAGEEGIPSNQYKRPTGKVWAAVNGVETQRPGYNYTLEAWRAVLNMFFSPVFCIRMSREETDADDIPDGWSPMNLANAILHRLWEQKDINSREADASKAQEPAVTVVTPSDATSEAAHLAHCKTCNRILAFECEQLVKAEAVAEADPTTRRCNICGAVLKGVFVDNFCPNCAATENVEADE